MILIIKNITFYFLGFLEFMVFIECICSWIPFINNSQFYYYVTKFNYPFLEPIRKILRKYSGMMLDLSPIILFLVIDMIRRIL